MGIPKAPHVPDLSCMFRIRRSRREGGREWEGGGGLMRSIITRRVGGGNRFEKEGRNLVRKVTKYLASLPEYSS